MISSKMVKLAGVDGCKGGWVAAIFNQKSKAYTFEVCESFDEIVDQIQIVAVDIPIGLKEDAWSRRCDSYARKLLGAPRCSSVFPAPIRQSLKAHTYSEAKEICKRYSNKSMTKQTFCILKKIADVDRVVRAVGQNRIIEVHPEICFWALNKRKSMVYNKRSESGATERRRLLSKFIPRVDLVVSEGIKRWHGKAKRDDLIDALAAVVTVQQYRKGNFNSLPPGVNEEKDGCDLRMAMIYPSVSSIL